MMKVKNISKFCISTFWIFLLLFLKVECLQKFLEAPAASEVSPGKDILLTCKVQNRRGTCSWQKDGKPVGTYAGKYEWAGGPAGGTGGGEDCSLWVRQASLQLDDGLWQCQVTASSYDAQDALSSVPVPLSVHVPPQPPRLLLDGTPLSPTRPLPAAQGKRTSVLCEARYGNPPAAISWYLDEEQLTAWSQTNSSETERPRVWAARSALELIGSRSAHGRVLSCRAAHPAYPAPGYKVATAVLDVTFPPSARVMMGEGVRLESVEEGGRVNIRCVADGNPAPTIWWTRAASLAAPSTGPSDTLLLAPVVRNHSGTYVCHAKNSMGESDPVSIEIDVKYDAKVVWVGPEPSVQATLFSRVVLECRAEGNPPPRYLWTHLPLESLDTDPSGGMPVGRDSQLVLVNVSYHQQGSYRCTAANTISGRERWHAADALTLSVVGPPVGERPEGGSSPAEGTIGSDASVSALVCAEPPPKKAAWHWGSLTLTVPAQIGRYRSVSGVKQGACYLYTLHIQSSTMQDARTYLLRVENDRGATTHAASLVLRETAALAPIIGAVIMAVALLLALFCIGYKCRASKEKNTYSSSELNDTSNTRLCVGAGSVRLCVSRPLNCQLSYSGANIGMQLRKLSHEDGSHDEKTSNIFGHHAHRVRNPYSSTAAYSMEAGTTLPADAVYTRGGGGTAYSPDALKETVEVDKDHVYSVLDPRVQYDVTISRVGVPATHLTVSRPLGAPPLIPIPTPEPPQLNRVPKYRKSGRSSGKSSSSNNRKPRPKSLQAYDNPKYLDHLFPVTAEI